MLRVHKEMDEKVPISHFLSLYFKKGFLALLLTFAVVLNKPIYMFDQFLSKHRQSTNDNICIKPSLFPSGSTSSSINGTKSRAPANSPKNRRVVILL